MDSQSRLSSVRPIVLAVIEGVAAEHGAVLPPVDDALHLVESGLDSLCLAVIVARLEDQLGVDPFSTADDMELPVTIGDLIELYEHAVRGK